MPRSFGILHKRNKENESGDRQIKRMVVSAVKHGPVLMTPPSSSRILLSLLSATWNLRMRTSFLCKRIRLTM